MNGRRTNELFQILHSENQVSLLLPLNHFVSSLSVPLEGKSFGKKDEKVGKGRQGGAWVKKPRVGKSSVGTVHVDRLRLLPWKWRFWSNHENQSLSLFHFWVLNTFLHDDVHFNDMLLQNGKNHRCTSYDLDCDIMIIILWLWYCDNVILWYYSPAMIWTVILSLMPSVGPQVYLLTDMYHIQ